MNISRLTLTRRGLLQAGALAGTASVLGLKMLGDAPPADASSPPPTPFRFTPFSRELFIPPVLQPAALDSPVGQVFHGVAPEFGPTVPPSFQHAANIIRQQLRFPLKTYISHMREGVAEIIPGVQTPIFGYAGTGSPTVPGPTFIGKYGEPIIVRYVNDLHVETSVHLHGAHTPAHSDGSPDFYVLPGRARDYYYPNIVPLENGQPDFNESVSTMWYHDHAMDITGHNANRGLQGFSLFFDDHEQNLIDTRVLPGGYGKYDIPLNCGDKRLNADGSIFYDFFDHNGQLGDVLVVNGQAQPFFRVERRKYRFRILTASTARIFAYRLSWGAKFLTIGSDSWLLPKAIEENVITLGMAQRADVIVDFTNAPSECYLQNVMQQKDGRGPEGIDVSKPTNLLKFIVSGPVVTNDVTVKVGTPLRPNTPIRADEIVATRRFVFERSNGAWKINNLFFNPERADAVPRLDGAERWILQNKSGGWWHPIHIHLESHQVQSTQGVVSRPRIGLKSDTTLLSGNGTAEIFMKFRTFTGPFVFHCHNLEHEDMRMMTTFDPRPKGTTRPLGPNGRPKRELIVTGVPEGSAVDLFAEEATDVKLLGDPPRDSEVIGEIRAP